jgi:DNA-binding NtrC family response regulator
MIQTEQTARLLIVDDVVGNVELLVRLLEPLGHELLVAGDGITALSLAERARPDLILLDVMMPGMDGLEVCRRLKRDAALADIPVLFITALDEAENLFAGFAAGAVDYVIKPFKNEEILARVATHLALLRARRALEEKHQALLQRSLELEAANQRLIEERDARMRSEAALESVGRQLSSMSEREAERWGIAGFAGNSATMRRILGDIDKLQHNADTSVLITGESGTGKELVARAIHHNSARRQRPFIPLNCVAIPGELAESMLFGHVRGAFTGANADRKGCFELAEGGTLFLDEIGDMPLGLQAKLLRVLEDGIVTPVGSSRSVNTHVRVIAATNADFQQRIAQGHFRLDLYYRLARFHLALPPLRERVGDITLLARHFVGLFTAEMGVAARPLSPEFLAALEAYPFPGNVRELKNLIERALILAGGDVLRVEHLQFAPQFSGQMGTPAVTATASGVASQAVSDWPYSLKEVERLAVQRALHACGGNISRAAALGLARNLAGIA